MTFKGRDAVVIEVGVVAGYVIAWAVRKVKRAGRRLDAQVDAVIDDSLDQLHEIVESKLGNHPVLAKLVQEAENAGQVTDPTRQQLELALTAAADEDDTFARMVSELAKQLQGRAQGTATSETAPLGSASFARDIDAKVERGGIAIGQVIGDVTVNGEPPGPFRPGRISH